MIISRFLFGLFVDHLFYQCLMVLGLCFRAFWTRVFRLFGNREIVKTSTTLERQLDFQGLAGFDSVCFVLFFDVWFLEGFGNGFLVIWGWIWAPF